MHYKKNQKYKMILNYFNEHKNLKISCFITILMTKNQKLKMNKIHSKNNNHLMLL